MTMSDSGGSGGMPSTSKHTTGTAKVHARIIASSAPLIGATEEFPATRVVVFPPPGQEGLRGRQRLAPQVRRDGAPEPRAHGKEPA